MDGFDVEVVTMNVTPVEVVWLWADRRFTVSCGPADRDLSLRHWVQGMSPGEVRGRAPRREKQK